MNRLLWTFYALVTAGLAIPAYAQNAPAPQESGVLEEIIITAERRTQSVQTSSLAIQVLDAEALQDAGVTQLRDLTAVAPGVRIGQGGPATQVYIRGVGDFGSTPVTNAAVATYVDGIYVPRSNAIEGNLYDLARVEVLKGPQGTLYGRNASGGALNIISNRPSLGDFGGNANIEIGNYNAIATHGALNVPVDENLAFRGAFQVVSRDGYSSMGFDDDDKQSARLSALWEPNDDVSLYVKADWTHVGGIGPGYDLDTIFPAGLRAALTGLGIEIPTDPRISITDPRAAAVVYGIEALAPPFPIRPYCVPNFVLASAAVNGAPAPIPPGTQAFCPPGTTVTIDPSTWQSQAGQDNTFWNLTAELNWTLEGLGTLTILPGYRDVSNDYRTFPTLFYDTSGRGNDETSKATSLEVRWANQIDLLDYVLGLYYLNEDQDTFAIVKPFANNTFRPTAITTTNYAAFSQASWHLSDQLRLITGVRYSTETKEMKGSTFDIYPSLSFAAGQPCFNGPSFCPTSAFGGSVDFDSTTWKAGLEYDAAADNMLFFTVATGFKSGGFNAIQATQAGDPLPYLPEAMTAYELGSRNRFFDGRLQLNVEAFYWEYEDHQEPRIRDDATGQPQFILTNAGEATLHGADVDIALRLTDSDVFRLNAEYLHSNYDSFIYQDRGLMQGLTSACVVTPPTPGPFDQTVDCSGFPLTRAPEWSGSVSHTHTFAFGNGGFIDATISGQFATENYLSAYFTEQVLAPDYFDGNASATYRTADGRWVLAAFVRNFNDEEVFTGAITLPGILPNVVARNVGAPRTYGVRLGVNF